VSDRVTATIEVAPLGSYVRVRAKGMLSCAVRDDDEKYHGGTRGRVAGFSRKSRKRLLDWLNQVDRKEASRALFVTLTYPKRYSGDWSDWKRDLDVLIKRMRRKWNKCSIVWRLEYQERGAPHFHLLVFGADFIPHRWLARAWYDVVQSGDPNHLKAGTEVRRVKSFRQVCYYAAKYISKVQDAPSRADGRMWGIYGREFLPVFLVTFCLGDREYYQAKRYLKRWLKGRLRKKIRWSGSRSQGLTAYLAGKEGLRLIEHLGASLLEKS
jgi:hypothetical protein